MSLAHGIGKKIPHASSTLPVPPTHFFHSFRYMFCYFSFFGLLRKWLRPQAKALNTWQRQEALAFFP